MLSKLSIFASLASIAVSSSYKIATPVSASGSSATLSPAGSPIAVSSVAGTVLTNASSSVYSGLGTWYGGTCGESGCWQKGACAFVDYVLPATIDGSTCVAEEIWNNGYHCGACVEIMYNGKKKIAMVTNKTGGNATHLDMTPDMFSQIADKSLGGINIKWDFVPCPISAPLEIRMHSGASKWWFAATVENATLRTAKMEVSADSGNTWKATTRNVNNFFELSSTGGGTSTTTAWIRVASENGSEVVIENVNMAAGTVATATTNYS
ncbi:RlpA-like double-psi beta-barrel-protein domain-containing protein-containing protein [Hyaloscypha finlandica]|nr:RlpA-like double-psi beta-barrel-protein domain-containing protein-containing protein [Hyaloscypha finlandica]